MGPSSASQRVKARGTWDLLTKISMNSHFSDCHVFNYICPPKCGDVSTSGASRCNLFGNKVFLDITQNLGLCWHSESASWELKKRIISPCHLQREHSPADTWSKDWGHTLLQFKILSLWHCVNSPDELIFQLPIFLRPDLFHVCQPNNNSRPWNQKQIGVSSVSLDISQKPNKQLV